MTANPEDKATWPPGPWHDEPDELEWVDQETGLHCRIHRGPVGALCGYVGIPKLHPAYGLDYSPIDYSLRESGENVEWWRRNITHRIEYQVADITVHGGLTFAGGERNGIWYFGFDCAHAFDLTPAIGTDLIDDIYRDIEYVKRECASLAKQLAAIRLWPEFNDE